MKTLRFLIVLMTAIAVMTATSCDPAGNDVPKDKTETEDGKNNEDNKENEGNKEDENPEEGEKPKETQFKIKVYDITSVSATVEVEPVDTEAPYYTDILSAGDFSQTIEYGFDDYMKWLLEHLSEKHGKTRNEVIEMISSYGNDGFITTTLDPETEYYAVAVGIDENGMTTTDVVYEKFSTSKAEVSENAFGINVSNITTSSATINVTTENPDPYIVVIEPSSCIEGLEGKELADYIIQNHIAWGGLEQMTYSSDTNIEHTGKSGWEYDVIVFGYSEGTATTEVLKTPFTMSEGGDPEACTFSFGSKFGEFDMHLEATPSDNSVVYVGNLIRKNDLESLIAANGSLEAALTENLESMIEELIADCGTRARVIDLITVMGPLDYSLKYTYETEYIQWVVAIDQNGNTTAPFVCSDPFTSPAEKLSDATLTIKECKWFDGAELAKVFPEYKMFEDYAVVDLTVDASEEAETWISYIALEDLTDRTREVIIKNLNNAPTQPGLKRQLIPAYWGTNTVMGVAQDAEGVYGPLLLEVLEITKETASDISEFKK